MKLKFNTVIDVVLAIIVIVVGCSVWGCSLFKPGTLTRVEEIAVEDAVELVADEAKELENDIEKPTSSQPYHKQ